MKHIENINYLFIFVITLFLVACNSQDELDLCGQEEYNPDSQICCGNTVYDLIDKETECRQSISVLVPTNSNENNAEGIARLQELPNNTLEVFILIKNLDPQKKYYTAITEYGDISTPNGTAMGDPIQMKCENDEEDCSGQEGSGDLGEIKFINEYTSATGFIKEDLFIRGDQTILGKGIIVYSEVANDTANANNTEEVVLQGTIALCGKWCIDHYPINEALINHNNWTWYIPHTNNTY